MLGERESELRARVCKAHGREYVQMQMHMSERRTQYTIAQTFSRLNADQLCARAVNV
jgi:hypothetical protein